MSYIPECPVAPCPACGSFPEAKVAWFGNRVRLACKCGVSGQWTTIRAGAVTSSQVFNSGIAGWEAVAGTWADPLSWPRLKA